MHLSPRADRAADAALVAGLALGDPPAATAFVRRFQGNVYGLALSITRNTAIDAVRARRTTPMSPQVLEDVVEDTFTGTDPAETALHRIDSARAVRHLATLHPTQARAVVLAVVGGCTAVEVSEHEEIPLGTAKTRIRTGLMRLRASMQEEAGE